MTCKELPKLLMTSENFGSNQMKPLSQISWVHDCNLIIQLHISQVGFSQGTNKFSGKENSF